MNVLSNQQSEYVDVYHGFTRITTLTYPCVICLEQAALMRFLAITPISDRVSHTLNNWVDGVSDEAYYPWESPKKEID